MALVDGFLELERSSGKLEWSAILQKMASDLGFSKILFGLLPKDSQDYENAFIVGNYPAAWREHYDRAGYARVDPTVSHCTQSVLPIFWEPSIYQTRKYIGKGRFSPFSKRLPQDWLIPKRLQKVSWLSRRAVRVAFARKAMFWGCVLSCEAIALIFSDVSSSLARVRVHRNLSHLLVIKL